MWLKPRHVVSLCSSLPSSRVITCNDAFDRSWTSTRPLWVVSSLHELRLCHLWRRRPAYTAPPPPSVTHRLSPQQQKQQHGGATSEEPLISTGVLWLAWTPEESADHPGTMPTVLGGKGKLSVVCYLLRCAYSQVRGDIEPTLKRQINEWVVCL